MNWGTGKEIDDVEGCLVQEGFKFWFLDDFNQLQSQPTCFSFPLHLFFFFFSRRYCTWLWNFSCDLPQCILCWILAFICLSLRAYDYPLTLYPWASNINPPTQPSPCSAITREDPSFLFNTVDEKVCFYLKYHWWMSWQQICKLYYFFSL